MKVRLFITSTKNNRIKDPLTHIQKIIMKPLREFKNEEYVKNPHAEKLDYLLLVNLNDMSALYAREAGIPEEQFMPCGVLGEIFTRRPKSLAALKKIDGLHPDVVNCYGLSYVNLIREHCKLEKRALSM